jgi:hypothetical protein
VTGPAPSMPAPRQALLKLQFAPSFPVKKKAYLVSYDWTVRATEDYVIDSLAAAGVNARGCRLSVPSDVLRGEGNMVKELLKTCSNFPFLDADASLHTYQSLITRAPFVLMIDPTAADPVQSDATSLHSLEASPTLAFEVRCRFWYTFSSFSDGAQTQAHYDDAQERLEFEVPATPGAGTVPRVLDVGSDVGAPPADPAKLQLQLLFPQSTGLRRHTVLVPETLTVRAVMEGLRSKLGASRLPFEGSLLSVDPATLSAGSFRQAASFPCLDLDTEVAAYRDVSMRNTLFWISGLQPSSPALPPKQALKKQAMLKLQFAPSFPIPKKTYFVPYDWTVRAVEEYVIDSLAAAGLNAQGCRLSVPSDVLLGEGNIVRQLLKTCSNFPFLDADASLHTYHLLIERAPFVLMIDPAAGKHVAPDSSSLHSLEARPTVALEVCY